MFEPVLSFVSHVGQRSLQAVKEVGYHFALLVEAFYWLICGRWRRQPVRLAAIFKEAIRRGKGIELNTSSVRYGLSDLTQVGSDYSEEGQAKHRSAGATEALWVNGSPVFGGRDGGILADKKAAEAANPIHYISKTSAPMLLMHGTADTIVSPSQTDLLYQALQQNGIPSERYLVTGAAHGGKYWVQEPVLNVITDFFDRYLK